MLSARMKLLNVTRAASTRPCCALVPAAVAGTVNPAISALMATTQKKVTNLWRTFFISNLLKTDYKIVTYRFLLFTGPFQTRKPKQLWGAPELLIAQFSKP
jgi:hypothetical protein